MVNYIKEQIKKLHINLKDEQCEQLLKYYNMLIEYNNKCNLTAITDFKEVVLKHFVDSLSIVYIYDMNTDVSVVDIGTGKRERNVVYYPYTLTCSLLCSVSPVEADCAFFA